MAVCDKYCHNCAYYFANYKVNRHCNYIFVAGVPRPCEAGTGCTVKKRRRKKRS